MGIIQSIEQWIYPVMDLALFIFCLLKLKTNGAIYFIIGFGIQFFASLIWRILPLFQGASGNGLSKIYEIYNHISVLFYIISLVLLIIGISVISKPGTIQNGVNYQNISVRKFGNFVLYVALLVLGFIPFIIGAASLISSSSSYNSGNELFLIVMVIGFLIFLIAQVYFMVMLYRVWHYAINESKRLKLTPTIETPGMAIGYLFIPFYNFYWVFKSYGKISNDLNAIAKAKMSNETISNGLGIGISVLCLMGIIPYVGFVTGFVAIVLFPVFIYQLMAFCVRLSQINDITT
jgi:hypothetical protein